MIISATSARLITNLSSLKLRIALNSQIKQSDLLEWGKIIKKSQIYNKLDTIHSINNRLTTEQDFLIGSVYLDSIRTATINFTVYLEAFLKESLNSCMKNNYSLLNKGLSDKKITFTANDIVTFNDIEDIREKYINKVTDYKTLGMLWHKKYKNYSNFIGLPKEFSSDKLHKQLEALWKLRNDFTHSNNYVQELLINEKRYVISSKMDQEDYYIFVEFFVNIVDETINFLLKVDAKIREKWSISTEELT
ncbi:hypothetical protein NSQ54_03450 [Alkalihalobacillus sp. FSL W8-0930]